MYPGIFILAFELVGCKRKGVTVVRGFNFGQGPEYAFRASDSKVIFGATFSVG